MALRPDLTKTPPRLLALAAMVFLLAAVSISIKRESPSRMPDAAPAAAGATVPGEPGNLRGSMGLSVAERTDAAARAMKPNEAAHEAAARLGAFLGQGLAGNDPQIPWSELALAKWDLPEPAARAAASPSDTPFMPRLVRRILASQIFLWFVGVILVGVPLASMLWTELDRRRADRELELFDAPELVYAPFFRQSEPFSLPEGWDRALRAGQASESREPFRATSPRPLRGGKILAHPPWMQPVPPAAFDPLPRPDLRLAS